MVNLKNKIMKYLFIFLFPVCLFAQINRNQRIVYDSSKYFNNIKAGKGITVISSDSTTTFILDSGYVTTQFNENNTDTIPVLLLICDTTLLSRRQRHYSGITINGMPIENINHMTTPDLAPDDYKYDTVYFRNNNTYWQYGYEVRERINVFKVISSYNFEPPTSRLQYNNSYNHLYYLGEDKTRLSDNVIVWQCMEIKK